MIWDKDVSYRREGFLEAGWKGGGSGGCLELGDGWLRFEEGESGGLLVVVVVVVGG